MRCELLDSITRDHILLLNAAKIENGVITGEKGTSYICKLYVQYVMYIMSNLIVEPFDAVVFYFYFEGFTSGDVLPVDRLDASPNAFRVKTSVGV